MVKKERRARCLQLVDEVVRLPSFPSVVGKILSVMDDPRSDAADVARYIESDVGLSAQVLRLANSAYYGIPGAVNTVSGAVVVLGFKATRSLVLSAAVLQLMPSGQTNLPHPRLFWEHSLEVALIARALAGRVPENLEPEALFTAGLLHDVGCLLMETGLGSEYRPVLEKALRDHVPLDVVEQDVFGVDHGEITSMLLERWEMPESLRVACAFHHRPWDAPAFQGSAFVVHLADQQSKRFHPEAHGYLPAHDALSWPHAKKSLHIENLSDEDIVAMARQECGRAAKFFQLFT